MLTESILGDVLGQAGQQYNPVHFTVLYCAAESREAAQHLYDSCEN